MKTNLKQKITNYLNSLSDELRSKLEYRKNKPHTPKLNNLCKLLLVLFTVIYLLIGCFGGIKSSAAETTAPSDLTGYTVTVPAGWTATAGFGRFSLSGTFEGGDIYGFEIGYNPWEGENQAGVLFVIGSNYNISGYNGSPSFALNITGGDDVANSSLIQWFVDNNATFVNNNAPEEPTTLTVPAGIYYLQNIYNDLRGTIAFDTPFTTSNGEEFVSVEFAGYNNNQYTQVSYYTNPVTDAGPSPSVAKPIYNGVNGFTDISNCIIYLEDDTVIEYYDDLWDDTFIAVNSDTKLINLYNGALSIGDSEGYDSGYTDGAAAGYEEGYLQGNAQGMESGFMADFFGNIVKALDALTIFGNFSMLDIIEGVLGIMLALWILKLIAGG